MKRIWWLWMAAGYVLAHLFIIPLAIYRRQWWFVAIGTIFFVYVGHAVWQRRHYLWDRSEY